MCTWSSSLRADTRPRPLQPPSPPAPAPAEKGPCTKHWQSPSPRGTLLTQAGPRSLGMKLATNNYGLTQGSLGPRQREHGSRCAETPARTSGIRLGPQSWLTGLFPAWEQWGGTDHRRPRQPHPAPRPPGGCLSLPSSTHTLCQLPEGYRRCPGQGVVRRRAGPKVPGPWGSPRWPSEANLPPAPRAS